MRSLPFYRIAHSHDNFFGSVLSRWQTRYLKKVRGAIFSACVHEIYVWILISQTSAGSLRTDVRYDYPATTIDYCVLIHCYFITITVMMLIINSYSICYFRYFHYHDYYYYYYIIITSSLLYYYLMPLLFINSNDDLCVISFAKEPIERAILQ